MGRPELEEFLLRFRETSEAYWANHRERSLEEIQQGCVGCVDWKTGTKWKPGCSEEQITAIESAAGLSFPEDYRDFLRILNAPDRPALQFSYVGNDDSVTSNDTDGDAGESTGVDDDEHVSDSFGGEPTGVDEHISDTEEEPHIQQVDDVRVFTDWEFGSSDQDEALESLIDGIIFDVENNNMWRDHWGERPETAQERRDRVASLISEAPALIRVHGHRFMLSTLPSSPILSIHQTDAIIYADSLEDMLLKDFPELAGQLQSCCHRAQRRLQSCCHRAQRRDGINQENLEGIGNTPFWGDLFRLSPY